MQEMSRYRWASLAQQNAEQRTARERMALFPDRAEVLFTAPDIWVVSSPFEPHIACSLDDPT